MAVLTPAELKALDFGYLTGEDLVQYCATELLISRYQVNQDAFINGVKTAYGEIINKLSTRYNVALEITTKTADAREITLVKIVSMYAIRNILGNTQNISKWTSDLITAAVQDVFDIRNGQGSLDIENAPLITQSLAHLVPSSYTIIG